MTVDSRPALSPTDAAAHELGSYVRSAPAPDPAAALKGAFDAWYEATRTPGAPVVVRLALAPHSGNTRLNLPLDARQAALLAATLESSNTHLEVA